VKKNLLSKLDQVGLLLISVGNMSYLNLAQDIAVLTEDFHGLPQSTHTNATIVP
jgi:hypothetical protein